MLSELYCFVDCFVAMQQLLCRHAATNYACLIDKNLLPYLVTRQ